MVYFSKPRLEGRALEHELAGCAGHCVRMFDSKTKTWVLVKDDRDRAARIYMRRRAKSWQAELGEVGL